MKVILGKYRGGFSVDYYVYLLEKIGISEKVCKKITNVLDSMIPNFIIKALSNRKRKEIIRIDPWDVWSLDNTLSKIIVPALKRLKEQKHGSPLVSDDDVPEHLRSTSSKLIKKNEWDSDEFLHQRWDYVIDEMIWAFEQDLDEDYNYCNKEDNLRVEHGRLLFAKYYNCLWD